MGEMGWWRNLQKGNGLVAGPPKAEWAGGGSFKRGNGTKKFGKHGFDPLIVLAQDGVKSRAGEDYLHTNIDSPQPTWSCVIDW